MDAGFVDDLVFISRPNLPVFPVFFPVIRKFKFGDWFESDCILSQDFNDLACVPIAGACACRHLVGTAATIWKYVCRISGGRLREYYSAVLDLTHEPSGTTSQHMPYISKLERERQQEQKERERWIELARQIWTAG